MIDRRTEIEQLQALASHVRREAGSFQADSVEAAHAWLLLHHELPYYALSGTDDRSGLVLFRGQADCDWPLTTTCARRHSPQEQRATRRFNFVIGNLYRNMAENMDTLLRPLRPDSLSTYATAQHYEMATRLLDWTSNAAIAIYFAWDVPPNRPRPPRAAVYFLEFCRAAELGLKVILPPPLAQRVYRQRGVFTHLRAGLGNHLAASVGKISFPSRPPAPFVRVGRRGARHVDLLFPDPWLATLAHRSLHEPESMSLALFNLLTEAHPLYRDADGGIGVGPMTDYVPMIDFIDRLTGRWNGTTKIDDPAVLAKLARDNPRIFCWLARIDSTTGWMDPDIELIVVRLQLSLRSLFGDRLDALCC